MEDCYEGMRAALWRNIEGLSGLSEEQKEGLLASEMAAAIAATESGRPFVDIYGQEEATDDAADYEAETPAETRPVGKPSREHARTKERATFPHAPARKPFA